MPKLTVIGLDGAGFQLLDRWLTDGTLPTLSKCIDEGQHSAFRSPYPPVTSPSWRCYSTGVNPGKHGVFWWEQVDRDSNSVYLPRSTDFDAPDIWDYLGNGGFKSAIVNMPSTFPPQPLDGWLVCGGGGVDEESYTYPPDLQSELEERFDYQVFMSGTHRDIKDNPDAVEEVFDLIDKRFAVAGYLREEYDPDFLNLTLYYTNIFHHLLWDDTHTKDMWERIDKHLNEFIEDDENLIIISDHGSNKINNVFNINTWLEKQGYLVTNSQTISDWFYKFGVTQDRAIKIAARLGIKRVLKRLVPRDITDLLPRSDGSVTHQGKAEKIDWDQSTVMASGQGPVYVLNSNPPDRTELRDEVKEKLEQLTTPHGKPVARSVMNAEEVYEGPYVTDGPDTVIDQADHIYVSGAIGAEAVFEDPSNWEAENHRDGIFIARGPDIASNSNFDEQPCIYDILPTVLHWFGLAVPDQADGRVLTEIFADNSNPGTRGIELREYSSLTQEQSLGSDDEKQMRERLRDLGYLSG